MFHRDKDYVVTGRRGQDRRRVHGPHHGGQALVGGPAPGGRGQGRRAGARGEPDAGDHHPAELLPPLRQALGHDGYRPDRGRGVPPDLQAPRRSPSRPTSPSSATTTTTWSTARSRPSSTPWSRTSSSATPTASRCLVGTVAIESSEQPVAHARQARHQARGPQRQAPRARGRHRRPGGPPGRRDHRDEHGRPRYRHPAGRQPRVPRATTCMRAPRGRPRTRPTGRCYHEAALERGPAKICADEKQKVIARRRPVP